MKCTHRLWAHIVCGRILVVDGGLLSSVGGHRCGRASFVGGHHPWVCISRGWGVVVVRGRAWLLGAHCPWARIGRLGVVVIRGRASFMGA